ncbi:MAG: hypothetical protein Ct9H300mP27_12530 [Chloroflexota bacterium]|nr:MAG: hypothetical protein Ct9H300mP27_12530 [Chloroflexota bacterium]
MCGKRLTETFISTDQLDLSWTSKGGPLMLEMRNITPEEFLPWLSAESGLMAIG